MSSSTASAEYKKCRKCGVDKWVSEFRPVAARVSRDLLSSYCRECLRKDNRLSMKKLQKQHPEQISNYMRSYRKRRVDEGLALPTAKTTRARTLSDL